MARTQYTVTFPAAKAGDEVTWPNTVKIYPDAAGGRPLVNGYIEATGGSFTGWSDSTSVAFTRRGKDGAPETVTVTSGSPTGTGAAAPSNAASLPSPRSAWFSLSGSNSSGTLALEWAFGGGDADLLDLTDPTLPTTKVAGLWIVTANPGTPGSSDLNWAVLVELDPDDVDATAIGAPAVYGGRAQASAQAAYGLAVDVAMDVYVSNDTGSSRTFSGYVTLVCVPDPNL